MYAFHNIQGFLDVYRRAQDFILFFVSVIMHPLLNNQALTHDQPAMQEIRV